MDSKEKAMKVKMLQDILKNDFGITSSAELLEAMRTMPTVDISMFVLAPTEKSANKKSIENWRRLQTPERG